MEYTEIMKTQKINQIMDKRILGRTGYDNSDKPLALFWGASALEINIKSKEVWALISCNWTTHESWVAVEVNGYQTNRFIASKEPQWVCVARNLNVEKENLISIIKDTQAMAGDAEHVLFIHEIGLSDDGKFCALPERKLNIEFIGDSITSGEGLAGNPDEMDWIAQWMCASKTYARQTAKNLNANLSVVSQCGWGLCWGWDGNIHSNMPEHYNNVCSLLNSDYQKSLGTCNGYNFSVKNDFVVLNLGTNDNGAFFQTPWKDEKGIEYPRIVDEYNNANAKDTQLIKDGVISFLKNIRQKNPAAKIVWTWGMIKLVVVPSIIQNAINQYKTENQDYQVYFLELPAMEDVEVSDEDKGSRGHPGPKTHKLAAEKLTAFLQSLL